jgi:hypothetical protein
MPRLRKLAWVTAIVLGAGTLVTTALHLAPVRVALGWKPLGGAGCPFGYDKPETQTAAVDIELPSAPRPALGFVLERTTPSDIEHWATAHHVTCRKLAGGTVRECTSVPANGFAASTIWFRFQQGRLAGIQTLRRAAAADDAIAAFDATAGTLVAAVGPPGQRTGNTDLVKTGGALQQSMVAFDLPRYRAVIRVTNMGDGYALTESYAR